MLLSYINLVTLTFLERLSQQENISPSIAAEQTVEETDATHVINDPELDFIPPTPVETPEVPVFIPVQPTVNPTDSLNAPETALTCTTSLPSATTLPSRTTLPSTAVTVSGQPALPDPPEGEWPLVKFCIRD